MRLSAMGDRAVWRRGRVLGLLVVLGGMAGMAACGGGSSTAVTPIRVAVYADDGWPRLSTELSDRGLSVDTYRDKAGSHRPDTDGKTIVWVDNRGAGSRVYAYDVATGALRQVSSPDAQPAPNSARVDGDHVIWIDEREGQNNEHAYHARLSGGAETQLDTNPPGAYVEEVEVASSTVAWIERDSAKFRVLVYDIDTATSTRADAHDAGLKAQLQLDGDYVAWSDNRSWPVSGRDIYAYRISTQTELAVVTSTGDQYGPSLAAGTITWTDTRDSSDTDVYARALPTGVEFRVNQDNGSASQYDPSTDGRTIVWVDYRSGFGIPGAPNIYGYDLQSKNEFRVSQDTTGASQTYCRVAGDLVVWLDNRDGGLELYAYDLSTSSETRLTTTPTTTTRGRPVIAGTTVAWEDRRDPLAYQDVYAHDLGGAVGGMTDKNLSNGGFSRLYLEQHIAEYDVLVFGDSNASGLTTDRLAVFDAAVAAGVAVLGIGSDESGDPIGELLQGDSRFGLSFSTEYDTAPMQIDLASTTLSHPIFAALASSTTTTLVLERSPLSGESPAWDEQTYSTNPADASSPTDWTVLATMGTPMSLSGEAAIVTFTTSNGTRVILDGSANTDDRYRYWNSTRWRLLENEVRFLAGR